MLKTAPRPRNRLSSAPPVETAAAPAGQSAWHAASRVFLLGLAGSLLLWAAFPPLNLPLLAWIAPVPWLWLCFSEKPLGWRAYAALWLAGTIHWLLMLEGIRLAHPALYAGWIALAAYLGVYLAAFVGLTRVARHRLGLSLVLAAPVVWVGLELARGHLITGFSMGLLAHTQAEFPRLIQIADLAGGYTLSFVLMLVAACICAAIRERSYGHRDRLIGPVTVAIVAVVGTLAYGQWRLLEAPGRKEVRPARTHSLRVALVQGSLDTVFEVSPERMRQTLEHYRELTDRAVKEHADLDLVVWPESAFVMAETVIEEPLTAPRDSRLPVAELRSRLKLAQDDFHTLLAGEAARVNARHESGDGRAQLLVGSTTYSYGPGGVKVYNSALLADSTGQIAGRYYKTHPVMFGEYIPFGEAIPLLYRITPMGGGLSIGDGPQVFQIDGWRLSPSICFESTIPHLIRRQLAELRRRGTPADVLVNVTNDGWFWGTGMLDLHFRCGVFRAVENRKPLVVAANTGISTHVTGSGVIAGRGSRRQAEVLLAEVRRDGRTSPYAVVGDWPAGLCAVACFALAVLTWRGPAGAGLRT